MRNSNSKEDFYKALRKRCGRLMDGLPASDSDDELTQSKNVQLAKPSTELKKKNRKKDQTIEKTTSEIVSEISDVTKKSDCPLKSDLKLSKYVDGFKVVDSIPADDSDISDAFESDVEENTNPIEESKYIDGYKVVNSIPEDDSDISDAFDSDVEENTDESSKYVDGYKVVGIDNIPADDSDISDAFESDIEETVLSSENNMNSSKKTPVRSKALQKFIDDLGVDVTLLEKETPLVCPQNQETIVIDHSQRRGKQRKLKQEGPKPKKPKLTKEITHKEFMKNSAFELLKMIKPKEEKRAAANMDLVYKLGGKRRSAKPINYKLLIEQRKEHKKSVIDNRLVDKKLGNKIKKASSNRENRTMELSSQVGKFKDGVLKLSKKDIAKLNK